jgi:hypothetical protein
MAPENRIKAYIPLIVTSILGLALYFWVNDFVVEVVVKPVLGALWFLSLLVRSIPQWILWALFLLVMVLVAGSGLKRGPAASPPAWQAGGRTAGRVEIWTRRLSSAQKSVYARWRLAMEMRQLTRELLSPVEVEERVRLSLADLDLPEEMRAYLDAGNPAGLRKRRRRKPREAGLSEPLDMDPDEVIEFLRERLGLQVED